MIEKYVYEPEAYGANLDEYLANGWYRLGQYLFTTNILEYPNEVYNVFWLRYPVNDFVLNSKQKSLLRKVNNFKINVQKLKINEEVEAFYTLYKNSLDFEISPSLKDLLGLNLPHIKQDAFNSFAVTIKDGNKLIALGVLDLGQNATSGIINIIHPNYAKYSLGKALMLIKLSVTAQNKLQYFYPGYIGKEYTKFDYKLFLGKTIAQIWDVDLQKWVPYEKSKAFK